MKLRDKYSHLQNRWLGRLSTTPVLGSPAAAALVLTLLLTTLTPVAAAAVVSAQISTADDNCPASCECPSVFYVYCQSAGLTEADVSQIVSQVSPSVALLDFTGNQIRQLQPEAFKLLENLEYLFLSSNQIEEIPEKAFLCLQHLKQLKLSGNRLSKIHSNAFVDLVKIESLDLSNNNISSIQTGTFTNLKTLELLQLQGNPFPDLKPDVFAGLDSLLTLNISNAPNLDFIYDGAFSGLSALRTLDLSLNSLSSPPTSTFNGLTGLEELYLTHNLITNCSFLENSNPLSGSANGNSVDFLKTLKTLYLTANRIEAISADLFSSLTNLKRLDLSENMVDVIEPKAFKGLRLDYLSLQANQLYRLDPDAFDGALRISELDISRSFISSLALGVFDSFRDNSAFSVNLSGNALTYIHSDLFQGMRKLSVLDLSLNDISVIDPGALDDLELLEILDLSGNSLTVVTPDMVSGPVPSLRELRLQGNPVEKISGFEFYDQDAQILVQTEAKVVSLNSNWALVAWPYTQGSQLYWSLTVSCDPDASTTSSSSTSSSSSTYSSESQDCSPPNYEPILKPYLTQLNITKLAPDTAYEVCVLPVFVSPEVKVSQCVQLRTLAEKPEVTPGSVSDGDSNANGAVTLFRRFPHWNSIITFVGLLIIHVVRNL